MAAIKDVAKLAGMSVAVVSKYLKNPGSVRKDTLVKIENAITQLNYVPSPIARSLRTKRTGMISVVVPSITNPFFAELFDYIRQACISKSMLAILQTAENEDEMVATLNSIMSRQFDGVIFCFLDNEQIINELKIRAPHIPSTVMNWHGIDSTHGNIVLDVSRGIFEATSYLITKGCSQIGYVGGPKGSIISNEKFKGFISAIEKSKAQNIISSINENVISSIEVNSISRITNEANFSHLVSQDMIKIGKQTIRFGHDAMKEIYAKNPNVQAIVCENDALAIGCLTFCLHENIKVPGKVMVTGFDDIPLASMFQPSLTTVRLPIEDMANCAIDMLNEQLDGNMKLETKVFDTQFIARETTK